MSNQTLFAPSLEGVVVGESSISEVDGAKGRLTYRGLSIDQLLGKPYLQIAALLACEQTPQQTELQQFVEYMQAHNQLSEQELALLNALPAELHPMLVLQAMLPALAGAATQTQFGLPLTRPDAQHGYVLAAKIPAVLCAWRQRELGLEQGQLVHCNNPVEQFLRNFSGCEVSSLAVEVLNSCQVLQMEHSFNASTFAGRVCASTNAPIQSVLSVSVGTLYGPLHGGADQAALEMAQRVGSPEAAETYVRQQLANKQKIMGMGHREYKVLDPRAALLKPMAAKLCGKNPDAKNLFATLLAVEKACQQEFAASNKQIWANVEYYKGAVFHALGIPSHYFTALFAMARVFGYLAHYEEFARVSKLIRPTARYVGT